MRMLDDILIIGEPPQISYILKLSDSEKVVAKKQYQADCKAEADWLHETFKKVNFTSYPQAYIALNEHVTELRRLAEEK